MTHLAFCRRNIQKLDRFISPSPFLAHIAMQMLPRSQQVFMLRLQLTAAVLWGVLGNSFARAQSDTVDFKTQIRPILSDKCFHCHGPDEKTRETDLRLDVESSAIGRSDNAAPFKARDLEGSIAWQRIVSDEPSEKMPPPDCGRSLTPKQMDLIQKWIEQGAVWEEHWSLIPPSKRPIPLDLSSHAATPVAAVQPQNPIDAWIDHRLNRIGLLANPSAEPRRLARRMYLDLIGIPPTPEQMERFFSYDASERVERLLAELLASPQFGEKWGRQWLDAARYADSDGFEKDKPRSVWFYRDWVVRAFNNDMPYDQFIIHQLAGDLLPNADQDSLVATGFLRNSMINEEGGVDPEQFRMEAMFDRMDAIGKSILGLAINCSQCHDHKYDPLSQQDYYGMFAMLNNSHEASATVYDSHEQLLRAKILSEISKIEETLKHRLPDWNDRMIEWSRRVKGDQPNWRVIELAWNFDSLGGCKLLPQSDGSYLAQSYAPTKSEFNGQVTLPAGPINALRLELLTDPNLPRTGPGRSIYGTGALSEIKVFAAPANDPDKKSQVKIKQATADINPTSEPLPAIYADKSDTKRSVGPIEYAVDGKPETAWSFDAGPVLTHQARKAVFELESAIDHLEGTILWIHLQQNHGGWNSDDNQNCNLGRFRISISDQPQLHADPLPAIVRSAIENTEPDDWDPMTRERVFQYWRTIQPDWQAENERIADLWKSHPWGTSQLVLKERESPRMTSLLERGDQFKPSKPVVPSVPQFLHPIRFEGPQPNRLDFARWLVDRRNPLAARAIVNRIWQSYFGTGLVATSEDFGAQGESPVHPELLDWLACELMDSGWSLKHIHRQIVRSNAYQRSSQVRPEHREKDPGNRLLSRGPRLRLDGESLRDSMMQVAGVLNRQVGGQPYFPPAPDFLFLPPVSYGPKTWVESQGGDRFRRSIYVFRFRSVPYPPLQVFDTPNGDFSCIRRSNSNSPLQALTALNEPFFAECAQALARRTIDRPGKRADQIQWLFEQVLARPPSQDEQRMLEELWSDSYHSIADATQARLIAGLETSISANAPPFANHSEGLEKELATWTLVSRVVLNLDEAITKE